MKIDRDTVGDLLFAAMIIIAVVYVLVSAFMGQPIELDW